MRRRARTGCYLRPLFPTVRRKFKLSERQIRSWERQELISAAESYSFSDLIAIQALIKLRENHIRPGKSAAP